MKESRKSASGPTGAALGVWRRRWRPRAARLGRIVLWLAVLAALMPSPAPTEAATFRVVDGDTGEPLEGTVVVVVWTKPSPLHPHGGSVPFRVVERITDPAGQFSANGTALMADRRDVTVYKPGYHPLMASTREQRAPLFDQTVIGLTKLKTIEEARAYRSVTDLRVRVCADPQDWACVRAQEVPRLIRVFAIHRKIFFPRTAGLPEGEEGQR